MTTIKEAAQAYKPKQMENITTLQQIPVDIEKYEKELKKGKTDYNFIYSSEIYDDTS